MPRLAKLGSVERGAGNLGTCVAARVGRRTADVPAKSFELSPWGNFEAGGWMASVVQGRFSGHI